MLKWLLNRIDWRVGVAVTGDRLIVQRMPAEAEPIVIENRHAGNPPPAPPAELPRDGRNGLTTRRHLRADPLERPMIEEGVIYALEEVGHHLRAAIRRVRPRGLRGIIAPRILVTAQFGDADLRKRSWLGVLEGAGARRVFLTQFAITCAVGLRLPLDRERAIGLLALECDWMEYATIGYASTLVECSHAVGLNDLLDDLRWYVAEAHGVLVSRTEMREYLQQTGLYGAGDLAGHATDGTGAGAEAVHLAAGELHEAAATCLRRLSGLIRASLVDLTDEQTAELRRRGIILCGDGSAVRGLPDALAERLALPVTHQHAPPHPAIRGLAVHAEQMNEWEQVLKLE